MRTKTAGAGNVVVGLDLGTTKICALIAETTGSGRVKIIGVGNSASEGMRRGVVIDVEKTVQAIRRAVEEAELMAGVQVVAAYVGIAGEHVGSRNSRGVVAVGGSEGEVSPLDKERVIDAARAVSLPIDREVLHVLPQEFFVDGQGGIRDPVGMVGVRLEADVHIVTGAVTAAQNICKSILRADFEVRDIVLEPLASSYAVRDAAERDMGGCLIDGGGGTTDVTLFGRGSVRHTAVIGLGGQNVTNDVAIGLRTSWPQAEAIKCTHGAALSEQVEKEEVIEVPGIAGRPPRRVPRRELVTIIEPRMEEIFTMVRDPLRKMENPGTLGAGVVLTGGGVLLQGTVDLAEQVFEVPVRLGLPRGPRGTSLEGMADRVNSPIYATALGLVLFGMENMGMGKVNVQHRASGLGEGRFDAVLERMREWFHAWV